MANFKSDERAGLTMTILGCGNLGLAILKGVLLAVKRGFPVLKTTEFENVPFRFIACVKHASSVARLEKEITHFLYNGNATKDISFEVWQGRNVEAVQQADFVILGCQPHQTATILSKSRMGVAIGGKLLISVCAGLSPSNLHDQIYGYFNAESRSPQDSCYIVQSMPSTASGIQESATIISESEPALPLHLESLTTWVFECIGTVTRVPAKLMDGAGITAASTPAFFALALEGTIQGALNEGLDRGVAMRIAAQAMKGTAEMVLRGEEPTVLMDKVMTPGGCTAKGVDILNAGRVADLYTGAIHQATLRSKGMAAV